MIVSDIFYQRPSEVPILSPRMYISDFLSALDSHDVGAFAVGDDSRSVVGIISERDIVRDLENYGEEILDQRIREVMTKQVVRCSISAPLPAVAARMCELNIRHMPVFDEDECVGMISMKDLLVFYVQRVRNEARDIDEYLTASHRAV